MADNVFDVDPELLSGFVDDSLDDLEALGTLFVDLEAQPNNLDIISSIFRPVHSIKGNSAFFGLMKMKELAHEMETLLDLARKGQLVPTESHISILLEGIDALKDILSRTRDHQSEIEDEDTFKDLVSRVVALQSGDGGSDQLLGQIFERLQQLHNESAELENFHLQELEGIIEGVRTLVDETSGETPPEKEDGNSTPEELNTIIQLLSKPCEGNLSDQDSDCILKCLQTLKGLTENPKAQELLDAALDEYNTMVAVIGFDPLLQELTKAKADELATLDGWQGCDSSESNTEQAPSDGTAKDADSDESSTAQPEAKAKAAAEPQKTMRVAEDSIDNFLNYVGELIVIGEMYTYLQSKASADVESTFAAEFKRVNETFSNLSTSLQHSIMEIRKVPAKLMLQKVPRMIRDIATASGKDIKVTLEGEKVAIDKRLMETLDAPLTHMVRNAADHGVETPEVREAAGKPAQGSIVVAVREDADNITLAITDDGKGLDLVAIKKKAVSLGIANENEEMTEEQITQLLFASGVSTAEKITDVSGRGVGMDVVRRNIEDANGKIGISTTAGQGSVFTITLPKAVSTQIIDGYLVKIDGNRYVLPLDRVREVFRITADNVNSVTGQGECVVRQGELLPVVRIFGNSFDFVEASEETTTMVTIENKKERVALLVDDVLGIQRVVLKELQGLELQSDVYSGAAVMGDGTVAMVLDTECIREAVM